MSDNTAPAGGARPGTAHTTDDALRHADGCDPMSAAYIRGLVDLVYATRMKMAARQRGLEGEVRRLESVVTRLCEELGADPGEYMR